LAARAGLSTEAVSLFERGRRTPRLTTLRLLADALGLPEIDRVSFLDSVPGKLSSSHRLPEFADSLIGRADEVAAMSSILERKSSRVLSVIGPGGVGKTRVAVASAVATAPHFASGVRWLPLRSSRGDTDFWAAVAAAVGLRRATRSSQHSVIDQVREAEILILIDHAEHLQDAIADLCTVLVSETHNLHLIVTSRRALQIKGEVVFPVTPLATSPLGRKPGQRDDSPASRLFAARAALPHDGASFDSVRSAHDAAAIAHICHGLDGNWLSKPPPPAPPC
jgi:predicted ATPase